MGNLERDIPYFLYFGDTNTVSVCKVARFFVTLRAVSSLGEILFISYEIIWIKFHEMGLQIVKNVI